MSPLGNWADLGLAAAAVCVVGLVFVWLYFAVRRRMKPLQFELPSDPQADRIRDFAPWRWELGDQIGLIVILAIVGLSTWIAMLEWLARA